MKEHLIIRIDKALHRKFKQLAREKDTTKSKMIIAYITKAVKLKL